MLLFALVCKIPSQFDWLLSDPPGSKLSIWDNIMLPNALPPPTTYLIAFTLLAALEGEPAGVYITATQVKNTHGRTATPLTRKHSEK